MYLKNQKKKRRNLLKPKFEGEGWEELKFKQSDFHQPKSHMKTDPFIYNPQTHDNIKHKRLS